VTYVRVNSEVVESIESAIQPNTKMIIVESPCNPVLTVIDLEKLAKLGQRKKIITVIDSTFAPPMIQVDGLRLLGAIRVRDRNYLKSSFPQ